MVARNVILMVQRWPVGVYFGGFLGRIRSGISSHPGKAQCDRPDGAAGTTASQGRHP